MQTNAPLLIYQNQCKESKGAFGRCGLPRRHADQHAVAWSAVRHVSVTHQPLRLEERACFSSLSPSAATDSSFQTAPCVPQGCLTRDKLREIGVRRTRHCSHAVPSPMMCLRHYHRCKSAHTDVDWFKMTWCDLWSNG
jgi:hypothetical protein